MSVTPIISDASQDHSFDLRREIALDAPSKLRGAHTKNEHAEQKLHSREKNGNFNESRVAIILGYFNGERYIAEQIGSIFNQTHQSLKIFLSDDQSTLKFSFDKLKLSNSQLKKTHIHHMECNLGFQKNFLNTLANINGKFDYFAFSDQDDIWHKDKLERAISQLSRVSPNIPALYFARTEIVDATGKRSLGYSPLFRKPPAFANALTQNIGGGNTMVFNSAARDLINSTSKNIDVVSHDWWCYQIVTGAGGYVVYDPEPCLKYRQHEHNLIGSNKGWIARFMRIRSLLQGRLRDWSNINLKALEDHKYLLTNANQRVLRDVIEARQSSLMRRLFLFKRSGIYRQTLFGNLALLLGILLNKV